MIDLRSDTVTRPTPAMRQAIAEAPVGDDVWGDDPTVTALEDQTAQLLGKAAAVFVPSGTQSNLCGLLAHCARGDEYLVGENAHTYRYEGGGAAVLGSIQPQPIRTLDDGRLDLDHAEAVIKPIDDHFARSRLLCMENTHDGKVLPLSHLDEAAGLARRHGLRFHLDGARLWNAAVALNVSPAAVAEPFDSVSVCLSKGLGAPVGSLLAGSTELISDARRWRKVLGGGMRQAGLLAAAGMYALDHNIERLGDDHANAKRLADGLSALQGVEVEAVNTNMAFIRFEDPNGLARQLEAADILFPASSGLTRLVTHLDVSADDVETVIKTVAELNR